MSRGEVRIVDDGKALTVSLVESDVLREFAGKLTRRNGEPDLSRSQGPCKPCLEPMLPSDIRFPLPRHLTTLESCISAVADWPMGINRGKVITRNTE